MKKAVFLLAVLLLLAVFMGGCVEESGEAAPAETTPATAPKDKMPAVPEAKPAEAPQSAAPDMFFNTDYIGSVDTGTYHLYSRFSPLTVIDIENNGGEEVEAIVEVWVTDYTDLFKNTYLVGPDEVVTVEATPIAKAGAFGSLNEVSPASLHVKVSYYDSQGNVRIFDEQTLEISLYPKDVILWGYFDENDEFIDLSSNVVAYVTPHEPEIDELIAKAVKYTSDGAFDSYQGDMLNVEDEAEAIYDALKNEYNFSYVDSSITYSSGEEVSQRIKLPKDALKLSSANCIDMTLVMASALENVGIDAYIMLVPEHAFLCYDLDAAGTDQQCIETTMIPTHSFAEAAEVGLQTLVENFDAETLSSVSVYEGRLEGITPLS